MYIEYEKHCELSEMLGQTLVEVNGLVKGGDSVTFLCQDGSEFLMYHGQDCCESVSIADVEGDVSDLTGSPLLVCEEIDNDPGHTDTIVEDYGSHTWTFYRLATAKGFVVIRWLGESNGYYSETVDFAKTK